MIARSTQRGASRRLTALMALRQLKKMWSGYLTVCLVVNLLLLIKAIPERNWISAVISGFSVLLLVLFGYLALKVARYTHELELRHHMIARSLGVNQELPWVVTTAERLGKKPRNSLNKEK